MPVTSINHWTKSRALTGLAVKKDAVIKKAMRIINRVRLFIAFILYVKKTKSKTIKRLIKYYKITHK